MFVGPPGSGKREAAEIFASLLGCQKQDNFLLLPQKSSIRIEQVRELQAWVRYGPSISPYLVVIVDQADTLTDQAAAAFLKILEEPPSGVVFILLVERPERLPLTIHSRSQKIIFAEKVKVWEGKKELEPFYEGLRRRLDKKNNALLLAKQLEKEKEGIEGLLYELSYFAFYKLSRVKAARIILDAIRFIKRKANLRLVLDVMCLRLGTENG